MVAMAETAKSQGKSATDKRADRGALSRVLMAIAWAASFSANGNITNSAS
jgi:hypothetical protein